MSFTCEWQTEEPKQRPSFHLLTNCPQVGTACQGLHNCSCSHLNRAPRHSQVPGMPVLTDSLITPSKGNEQFYVMHSRQLRFHRAKVLKFRQMENTTEEPLIHSYLLRHIFLAVNLKQSNFQGATATVYGDYTEHVVVAVQLRQTDNVMARKVVCLPCKCHLFDLTHVQNTS